MTNKINIINRLTISRQDFTKCQKFLGELSKYTNGSLTYEALLLYSIICYARPFSYNERNKGAKASAKIETAVLDTLTDKELKLHNLLLELRNKAIAHAEWSYHPTGVSKNGIISSMPFSIWSYFPSATEIQTFSRLVDKVLLKTHNLTADKIKSLY